MPVVLVRKALPPDDPLLQAADRLSGRIRQAFLDAIQAVQDQTTLSQLADAVASGDPGRVLDLLDLEKRLGSALGGGGLQAGVKSVREALQDTFAAGARVAMESLPSKMSVDLAFNLMNPETVKFLDKYTFDLIQQVTQETREAIQAVVVRAFKEGGSPYEQARQIKDFIGLTANQETAIANYRNALEGGAATDLRDALGRALRDGRYDKTLLNAINNNRSLSQTQVDKMVQRYRERFLQYRARNIARTESIRASNQGQRALWKQAIQQGLMPETVRRRWIVSGDDRTCLECLDLEDEERMMDDEFAPGVLEPPLHPSCRCTLALVADSMKFSAVTKHGIYVVVKYQEG